jgi:hypothetical protein
MSSHAMRSLVYRKFKTLSYELLSCKKQKTDEIRDSLEIMKHTFEEDDKLETVIKKIWWWNARERKPVLQKGWWR